MAPRVGYNHRVRVDSRCGGWGQCFEFCLKSTAVPKSRERVDSAQMHDLQTHRQRKTSKQASKTSSAYHHCVVSNHWLRSVVAIPPKAESGSHQRLGHIARRAEKDLPIQCCVSRAPWVVDQPRHLRISFVQQSLHPITLRGRIVLAQNVDLACDETR